MKSSNILILGVALLASVAFEDFAIQQSGFNVLAAKKGEGLVTAFPGS
jgi:hypothetical protein